MHELKHSLRLLADTLGSHQIFVEFVPTPYGVTILSSNLADRLIAAHELRRQGFTPNTI